MNTTSADAWLRDGCGRCDKYQTPECKVLLWTRPLVALRALLQGSGLAEEMKWGSPCYTLDGKNVVMLTALKDHCALSFLKGAALEDPDGLLERPGPNSHHARYLKFRTLADVTARRAATKRLLAQAIALERSGGKVKPKRAPDALPEELAARLERDAALARAFRALTPGRQRSHVLYVGAAKQAETRARRVEKCAVDIAAGRGFNERA